MSADEQRAAIRTALSQRDIDRLAIAAAECVTDRQGKVAA
jgi:hypothetical protein